MLKLKKFKQNYEKFFMDLMVISFKLHFLEKLNLYKSL